MPGECNACFPSANQTLKAKESASVELRPLARRPIAGSPRHCCAYRCAVPVDCIEPDGLTVASALIR
jgi:hypothetical protein